MAAIDLLPYDVHGDWNLDPAPVTVQFVRFIPTKALTIQVPIFSTARGEQRMRPSANLPTGRSS